MIKCWNFRFFVFVFFVWVTAQMWKFDLCIVVWLLKKCGECTLFFWLLIKCGKFYLLLLRKFIHLLIGYGWEFTCIFSLLFSCFLHLCSMWLLTHNVCLQIVKVFRLEPKVRGLEAADKKTESPVKEELSAVKKADRFRELTNLYGTKKARNEVSPLPLPLRLYNTIKSIL